MNRLESLDWLRGLLALSIMIYHLASWKLRPPDAGELLGRLGVYGVSMFFILSGLAMAAVYHGFVRDTQTAMRFFVRRIFRIWPLLWLAVAAVVVGGLLFKGRPVDWVLVLLNLTTLFGFIDPGAYVNTGAWSIGNEMVYYALTPMLLPLYDRDTRLGNAAVAAMTAVGAYFAFFALSPEATLAAQWPTYIHPFNNLFLYGIGVALYYNTRHASWSPRSAKALMLSSLALLAFYPVHGDLVNTVTGAGRCVFVLASTGLVLGFYKLPPTAGPHLIARPLTALGVATYGVYLLHPIIYPMVELALPRLGLAGSPWFSIAGTVACTIAGSILIYRYYEAPLIRLGKRLTTPASPPGPEGVPLADTGKA